MITADEIEEAARSRSNWDAQQIEQDVLLGRLMVEIACDDYLAEALVLKGGTCLHKLWLPQPWRYSKDLDYARTEDAPLGRTFDALRAAGERVGFDGAKTRVNRGRLLSHVTYRGTYIDGGALKVTVDLPTSPPTFAARTEQRPFEARSGSRTTRAQIVSLVPEEMIASKAAAIFGRKQPRDVYDIWAAKKAGLVTAQDAASCFQHYREPGWSRDRAQTNLERKLGDDAYREELEYYGIQAPVSFDIEECRAALGELIVECSLRSQPVRRIDP